jgi:hypothetical protein
MMFEVETLIFIRLNFHSYGSKEEGSKEEGCKESSKEEEGINSFSSTKQKLPPWEFLFSCILKRFSTL